ncbi:VOC family protein [Phormidium sp. FACHB-1136]|uniref:4-hydroxyphenylpyruvate dioxygenase family protein n=1 Tax=Phormidium sp. FACHB-1136 TaxID=2692848 RepID=UPI001688CAE0|nr:VOC family protein [Phormidium sp. FACHB-1136]MBD2424993.1 VOC family protein [Phormidium sp. FACHB-1136]
MDFNHLHLYVDDVAGWCDRFVQHWGGQAKAVHPSVAEHTALVYVGSVPVLISAPQQPGDGVADYLCQHPMGVGDLAFWVPDLEMALARLVAHGGQVLTPITEEPNGRWCQVRGWGHLRHTLVQSERPMAWVPGALAQDSRPESSVAPTPTLPSPALQASVPQTQTQTQTQTPERSTVHRLPISHIDHGVINVPAGQMAAAVDWYAQQFGFQPQQRFVIHTPWSGLRSQVLIHPQGGATLPINEPATANSQIQEFLDWNRGPGVQHVALHTEDIVQTVQRLKALEVIFLDVPQGYYHSLAQRPGDGGIEADWVRLQILADWDDDTPQAKLLQTFTQPIFPIPTLFFEIIQRQKSWANQRPIIAQGFGERNFQALFEAIEREQRKRGSLA